MNKNFYKLSFAFAMVLMLMSQSAWAQFKASGKITGPDGEPLVGATVLIKGTTVGSFTNDEGQFTLDMPGDEGILLITFVGYQTAEQTVSSSNPNINITLQDDDLLLDEVIITGYGTQQRKEVTSRE